MADLSWVFHGFRLLDTAAAQVLAEEARRTQPAFDAAAAEAAVRLQQLESRALRRATHRTSWDAPKT